MDITKLFFPLNRPEYPKNPEILQSALAWSLDDGKSKPDPTRGLVYEERVPSTAKSLKIVEARPSPSESIEILEELDLIIGGGGASESQLANSLWDELRAVSAQKAKAFSAMPLTLGTAMLQDPVGVHAKTGPPNFAQIIEQIYRAGAGRAVPSREAAWRWHNAVSASNDPLLGFLDRLAGQVLQNRIGRNPIPVIAKTAKAKDGLAADPPAWLQSVPTPMVWFYDSWNALCSDEWRNALPSQRWADWASCVLRMGIGCTFLWEACFFQRLGRLLLADQPADDLRSLLAPLPLLRWRESNLQISVRDENSRLIRTVLDGTRVRIFLGDVLESHDQEINNRWHASDGIIDFCEWFSRKASRSGSFRSELNNCFGGGKFSAANNVLETIRYLLLARSESGAQADFYGVLRRRSGRFLVVSPGEEWMVVLASLAAESPGKQCTLGRLRESLASLGIYAEREQVIQELERAGLSRSSHDADDALVVWSGF